MLDRAIVAAELQHSNLLLQLWLLHVVVSLVMVFGVAAVRLNRVAVRWLLAGYIGFAVTHLMCLQWILKQWGILAELAKSNLSAGDIERFAGVGLVEAPDFLWVVPIHLIASTATGVAIWRVAKLPTTSVT
jgi:hypothetical protein